MIAKLSTPIRFKNRAFTPFYSILMVRESENRPQVETLLPNVVVFEPLLPTILRCFGMNGKFRLTEKRGKHPVF